MHAQMMEDGGPEVIESGLFIDDMVAEVIGGSINRATFHAAPQWQRLRLPWSTFQPHGLREELDPERLRRVGLLGWMQEMKVDLALGEIALYS